MPNRADALDSVLTVAETAATLNVCSKTVRREIHAGQLKAIRVGRQIRVRHADFMAYLRSRYIRGNKK
jgi:excisionase family DNA binding protein